MNSETGQLPGGQMAARPAARQPSTGETVSLILTLLTFLISLGLWGHSPGLAVLFFLLIAVPCLGVTIRTLTHGGSQAATAVATGLSIGTPQAPVTASGPLTGAQKAGTFLKWFGIMAWSVMTLAGGAAILILVMAAVTVMSLITAIAQICGIK